MRTNIWTELLGLVDTGRYIKGNVVAVNADGSLSVATSDGAAIRARPLPGQVWAVGQGVFVQNGRIVDGAPELPGITQFV
jgi:hypothetical protein